MSTPCSVIEVQNEAEIDSLRDRVRDVEAEIFSLVQIPLEADRETIASFVLVRNATGLLSGPPGSGKTTLARLIGLAYFSDGEGPPDMAVVNCDQELTKFDFLYHLDLAELQQGREVVHPKDVVTRRLKFINEIQRAPGTLHNALLPLLSEREVNFRGTRFESPDYLCILDRNPTDEASQELPAAFLDRIDYGWIMPAPHLREALLIDAARRVNGHLSWDPLECRLGVHLGVEDLEKVWAAVAKVRVPASALLYAIMIFESFSLCVKEERSTLNPLFDLDCSGCAFRGEICSHLERVPGHRPLASLLRLAQAHAWRNGRSAVELADLRRCLPYVLGHRLELRRDLERTVPSPMAWIEDVAVGKILRSKGKVWTKAVQAVLDGNREVLESFEDADLVVRELGLFLDDPAVAMLRERHRCDQVMSSLGVIGEETPG